MICRVPALVTPKPRVVERLLILEGVEEGDAGSRDAAPAKTRLLEPEAERSFDSVEQDKACLLTKPDNGP
jgi:hypothetical protein